MLTVFTFILQWLSLSIADNTILYTNYACVVDAGSTGSRIHIYKYSTATNEPNTLISVDLNNEHYQKFKPGLSSFEEHPSHKEKYEEYWIPIINFAHKYVPIAKQSITPLFVLASAGMRKVRERDTKIANKIMDNTYKYLSSKTNFLIFKNGIQIIEGSDEGLWGWIAANYLNGELSKLLLNDGQIQSNTKGVLEMGGESLQMTFYINGRKNRNRSMNDLQLDSEKYIKKVVINDISLDIFTYSWMGIGLQATQKNFESFLKSKPNLNQNACYLSTTDISTFDECYSLLKEMILQSKEKCLKNENAGMICTPNNILIPHLFGNGMNEKNLRNVLENELENEIEFYFIENFYYTSRDLEFTSADMYGGKYRALLKKKGKEFCSFTTENAIAKYKTLSADDIQKTCFSSAYLLATIEVSFEFGEFEKYRVIRDINGVGIDWVLGYLVMIIPQMNSMADVLDDGHLLYNNSSFVSNVMLVLDKKRKMFFFFLVLCFVGCYACYAWNINISNVLIKLRRMYFFNSDETKNEVQYSRLRIV